MYGLEAISAANGWAQAATGATIVMLGLAVLSFIISQIGNIIDLIEKTFVSERNSQDSHKPNQPVEILPELPNRPLDSLEESIEIYKLATAASGDSFSLPELHNTMKKLNDPHPHLTVRTLREKGYIETIGDGRYKWINQ